MKYFSLALFLVCASCAQPATESICPALIPYTLEDQSGLSKELTEHPDLKYVPLFLAGYAQTRAALRVLSTPSDKANSS